MSNPPSDGGDYHGACARVPVAGGESIPGLEEIGNTYHVDVWRGVTEDRVMNWRNVLCEAIGWGYHDLRFYQFFIDRDQETLRGRLVMVTANRSGILQVYRLRGQGTAPIFRGDIVSLTAMGKGDPEHVTMRVLEDDPSTMVCMVGTRGFVFEAATGYRVMVEPDYSKWSDKALASIKVGEMPSVKAIQVLLSIRMMRNLGLHCIGEHHQEVVCHKMTPCSVDSVDGENGAGFLGVGALEMEGSPRLVVVGGGRVIIAQFGMGKSTPPKVVTRGLTIGESKHGEVKVFVESTTTKGGLWFKMVKIGHRIVLLSEGIMKLVIPLETKCDVLVRK